MKILVTGSAGFVGQVLVRRLQSDGHDIIGIDREADSTTHRFIRHDLTDVLPWKESFDVCVHLASAVGGFLYNTKAELVDINERINENVKQLCRDGHCRRLVFFSSINVFEVSQQYQHDRLLQKDQKSAYAVSKAQAEDDFTKSFEDTMIIRPTNIFGMSQGRNHERAGESHVIPDLLKKIEESNTVTVFGDGSQVRNFVHVNDIAEFVAKNLNFSGRLFFNLRSDITITIRELVEKLIQFKAKPVTLQFDPTHMRYEMFAIRNFDLTHPQQYGWQPKVRSIPEGLNS